MIDKAALIPISTLFNSKCGLCSRPVLRGVPVLWDRDERKVYHHGCVGISDRRPRTIQLLGDHIFQIRFEKRNFYLETLVEQIAGAMFDTTEDLYFIENVSPVSARQLLDLAEFHAFEYESEVLLKLAETIRTGTEAMLQSMARTSSFKVEGLKQELFGFQVSGIEFGVNNKKVIIADQMGLGKQQPIDTMVATPKGWRKIGSLKVGDYVIGSNGNPVLVLNVYPQGIKPSYKVTFSDHSSVEAGPEHLWTVLYWKGHNRSQKQPLILTTDQLRLRPKVGNLDLNKTSLYLPLLNLPIQYNANALPVPPYLVGVAIANGSLVGTSTSLCFNSKDVDDVLETLRAMGVVIGSKKQHRNSTHVTIKNTINLFRNLGLCVPSRDKFIPSSYLYASPEARIDLLHGLMDCDGSVSLRKNKLTYHTISKTLADHVQELIEGLGGIASVRCYDRAHENKPKEYQVRIRVPSFILPFRSSSRKSSRYHPGRLASPCRTVSSVEYVRDVESVCITVDSKDNLYVTEHAILTHNTIQAMGIIAHMKLFPAVVVCPAILKLNWQRELLAWMQDVSLEDIWVLQGRTSHMLPPAKIYIVNYDVLSDWVDALKKRAPKIVIYDEFHYVKTPGSIKKKTGELVGSKRSLAARELAKEREYVIGLTGTPILNRPEELIHPLRIIERLKEMGGKEYVEKRYCDAKKDNFGRWDTSGASNLAELNERLRSNGILIRRTKLDVLPDLPPKLPPTVIPIELSNNPEYRKAEKDLAKWLADKAIEDSEFKQSIAGLPALDQLKKTADRHRSVEYKARRNEERSRFIYLKRLSTQGKLHGIKEHVNNFMESGEKLLLFGWFIDTQIDLAQTWPWAAHVLGKDSDKQRAEAIDKFQTDPDCKMLIASLKVLGLGVNLTAASHVAFAELGWTPADHDQAEDRVHRIGQTMPVNVYYYIGLNSIEQDIIEIIDNKRKVIGAATDGAAANDQEIIKLLIGRLLKKYGDN